MCHLYHGKTLFPFADFTSYKNQHGHEAGRAADEIGNGFRSEHAVHLSAEEMRQQQGERNDDERFAKQGKENGLPGLSHGSESALSGKLQGHQEKSEKVNPHGGNGGRNQRGLLTENTNEEHRKKVQHPPDQRGVGDADHGHEGDGFFDPAILPGPIIEADHRLGAVCDAGDRHGDDFTDGIDDSHDAHIQVPAVTLKTRVADDLDGAVGDGHDKTRHAKGGNIPYQSRLQPHGSGTKLQNAPFPRQKGKGPQSGGRLGNDGGNGRAPNAQAQDKDENGIQQNIQNCADEHRTHTDPAKSLGVDKAVHAKPHHHKKAAAQVNGKVFVRKRKGGIAGPEQVEERTLEDKPGNGEDGAGKKQQEERISHDSFRFCKVSFSAGDGAEWRAAHAEEICKGDHDGNDGKAEPQPGEGKRRVFRQTADIHPVNDVI